MSARAEVVESSEARALDVVRAGLASACEPGWEAAEPELEGKLIRPLVAYAGAVGRTGAEPAPAVWKAALAVQLAHDASLLHDDVIDGAGTRRGVPTLAARCGPAAALVAGDHLLATAYRYAAETGSAAYAVRFARAVERTVAAEIAQGRAAGRVLSPGEYRSMVLGKSGELMGAALAADATLRGAPDAGFLFSLGRRVGLVYQMVDDLLDYCPAAETGKPGLADHRQKRWTWVLRPLGAEPFALSADEVVRRLGATGPDGSILAAALGELRAEVDLLMGEIAVALPHDPVLGSLLRGWVDRAAEAVAALPATSTPAAEEDRIPAAVPRIAVPAAGGPAAPSSALLRAAPALADLGGFLGRNSRSFAFAAAFFPAADRASIARVYAFCRVTDDLADHAEGGTAAAREALLDEWLGLARAAYGGQLSGIPLLDTAMPEMARAQVPFRYASDLVEGMRMDLRGRRYDTLAELRGYTYRVASVVGLWITELAGIRDPAVLARAAALGHAMQLTNVLRDVGEDLAYGRLYLPADRMVRHGVTEEGLGAMRRGETPISPGYRTLLEELMAIAEDEYDSAFPAIRALPRRYWRPVGVAAHVYRGIHDSIRRNGYDNLTRRARTTGLAKARLAARAVWELRSGRSTAPLLDPPGLLARR